ncbi:hypothetical protein OAF37_00105 [Rubripirellula sp.]|nr:hypothetical protein [Rubripirellula sp.]MDB4644434.1 hypothetical protein [Rubripirellula sp.]
MCQLNITVSDSADISFSEINASATTASSNTGLQSWKSNKQNSNVATVAN